MCNYTLPTKRGVHVCEQHDCNGREHYTVFYPYMRESKGETASLFVCAAVMGLSLGFLLYYYFGLDTLL